MSPSSQDKVEKSSKPVPNTETETAEATKPVEGYIESIKKDETDRLVNTRNLERNQMLTEP